jgi:hypothetical protein
MRPPIRSSVSTPNRINGSCTTPPARGTAANAPGVTWVHGSNIGMAESADGGATWTYRGTADITYGKDTHPGDYTYWAPEVIWFEGTYHMYLSYVPGIFADWNHPREIVHLTSKDGVKWTTVAKVDLTPAKPSTPASSSFRTAPGACGTRMKKSPSRCLTPIVRTSTTGKPRVLRSPISAAKAPR